MPTLFFLGPNAFSTTLYHLSLMFLPQKETFQTNLWKRVANMLPATFVHFCWYNESSSQIYMIHNHCVIHTHTIIVCTNKCTQVYKLISINLCAFLELLVYICSQNLHISYRSYVQRVNKNILSTYFTVHSHTQPKQIFNFHLGNKVQHNISHLFQGLQ